ADGFNDSREFRLIGLAGKVQLPTLQQFARLRLQLRYLVAQHFIMFVQTVKPVGQPPRARFQKRKAKLGKAIQQPFAQDHAESDHLFESVTKKMGVKKLVDAHGAGRFRSITPQEHVDTNRNVETRGLLVKRKEIGISYVTAAEVRQ